MRNNAIFFVFAASLMLISGNSYAQINPLQPLSPSGQLAVQLAYSCSCTHIPTLGDVPLDAIITCTNSTTPPSTLQCISSDVTPLQVGTANLLSRPSCDAAALAIQTGLNAGSYTCVPPLPPGTTFITQ
jgi:hypothetical protein